MWFASVDKILFWLKQQVRITCPLVHSTCLAPCRLPSPSSLSLPPIPSVYPVITSVSQRHEYKREFDSDLREYKHLCAEMDDIHDQLNKLSRQLDTLDESSAKYPVSCATADSTRGRQLPYRWRPLRRDSCPTRCVH